MAKRASGTGKSKPAAKPAARAGGALPLGDIRHPSATRRNIPPARIAAEGTVPAIPKAHYSYNPHLPPVLRFDQHGQADPCETRLSDAAQARADALLKASRSRPLTDAEAAELGTLLHDAARARVPAEPWLEWSGKRERPGFSVDPVALHIHERISAQAILKLAARQDTSKYLFADPEQEYHQAVQFYRHEVGWSNRLVLGDSLQVMSSLARREDLAGKVQMIYMDPPYGIKFASNFQPEVGKRDVKDKQEDLTREPEMVRAYRDTWHLGIHSYLSYLRDRLVVAKELLADTGSIFIQISDENVHRVRQVLDDVFGAENYVVTIPLKKKGNQKSSTIDPINDYLLWTTKDRSRASTKFRPLYKKIGDSDDDREVFRIAEFPSGEELTLTDFDSRNGAEQEPQLTRWFSSENATAGGQRKNQSVTIEVNGRVYDPGIEKGNCWKHTAQSEAGLSGMLRLALANRLYTGGKQVRLKRYASDFGMTPVTNWWDDFGGATDPVYVVQTNANVVARCMLMTTDPGDLVIDPTCGSGTTAYVAEQWGRRWITIDTSRVAIAIARQRLLTERFDSYKTVGTRSDSAGREIPDPASGFRYKTVPHISSSVIANCTALDPIFAKHEPALEAALKKANAELAAALKKTPSLRGALALKLARKEKEQGKGAVTDADRRRWLLPPENRKEHGSESRATKATVDLKFAGWYHWEVPFDTDPDWPRPLADAVTAYRAAWRAKMDEVNACIAASAEQEELVDQPDVVRGVTRVSGPFTVEAVQPPEMTLGDVMDDAGFAGGPEELDSQFQVRMVEPRAELEAANVGAYLDQMYRYIKADGVRFLNNKQMKWTRLEPLMEAGTANPFHAEGRWVGVGEADKDADGACNVAVVFGPQYGPVTAPVVTESLRQAHRRGYDHVVIAGFNFDGAAQTEADHQGNPKVKIHLAHIRPDINPGMHELLKESPKAGSGQLFTVFGQPRIAVRKSKKEEGMIEVEMEGVDIYNPATDEVVSTGAGKVAAWFLDGDYDGRTFCVTQAFFPDRSAWEKLQRALNGKDGPIDAERFEAFSGTVSLPFPKGKNACVAVKVIDPRGNEVMAVEKTP